MSLFTGVAGIEVGLSQAGHACVMMCENDVVARCVLRHHFPGVDIALDVKALERLPNADLVTAGFPCQDLSPAGRTAGINGDNSSLIGEVLRLLAVERNWPKWLLIENVPFMLQLQRGQAMNYLTQALEDAGFAWAYRVIDTRAFGLPHRRRRVILLASRSEDPRAVLLTQDAGLPQMDTTTEVAAYGFYWTEGNRGLGWAANAVPTLKSGSGLGIPSPPAIWLRNERALVTPSILDAERLQGFQAGWTEPAIEPPLGRAGMRWRLVGNAVSVPVARWVGERLNEPHPYNSSSDRQLAAQDRWPSAAWGSRGQVWRSDVSEWPVTTPFNAILDFLQSPTSLLSERSTAGFLRRANSSKLRFAEGFLQDVEHHLHRMQAQAVVRHQPKDTDDGRHARTD